ncbi:sialate O-acetylesterase [Zhouia spongiae]|uniref:Sialate O-acetylesterase n=1 Tax=Zhouia spongiae TaxID=2202721 RepID=A0ABY3YJD1_9FLAO|nr:sialate O-acetylesterase [Zhouia spongiae]UNY97742.1 sialate O-acetylesterase [Zhouia spongiae]
MNKRLLILLTMVFFTVEVYSQLSINKIFTDHMVLQRGEPLTIWGKGKPGAELKASFGNKTVTTKVVANGIWSLELPPQKPNRYGQKLRVYSGNEEIVLNNILVGDVWLCVGQSNMEWPLKQEKHFKQEQKYADQPLLRFYNPDFTGKYVYGVTYNDSLLNRLNTDEFYHRTNWEQSNLKSASTMSAVGYYFGSKIIKEQNIPVGLINLAIGGAPIETFIDRNILGNDARFSGKVKGDWLSNDALPEWVRERGTHNVGNVKVIYKDSLGPNHAYKPGFAFESGIKSLTKFPIKGLLWYQGESNAQEPERVTEYKELQKLMLFDYRKRWKNPDMPFYFVQLSSIDTLYYKGQLWPEFRNKQRRFMNETKMTGMAVSSDIGAKNDVHPRDKKNVGERLARWALKGVYKMKVLPSGPLVRKVRYRQGKLYIFFNHAGKGLTTFGKELRGFSLDNLPVKAKIKGRKIIIETTMKPTYVYYGWQPFSKGNLYNKEGLPASSFKQRIR